MHALLDEGELDDGQHEDDRKEDERLRAGVAELEVVEGVEAELRL